MYFKLAPQSFDMYRLFWQGYTLYNLEPHHSEKFLYLAIIYSFHHKGYDKFFSLQYFFSILETILEWNHLEYMILVEASWT